jgi:hypothetical protein
MTEELGTAGQMLGLMIERLGQGVAMFGDQAAWFWLFPALWLATIAGLWLYGQEMERRRNQAYLKAVSRRLPELSAVATARSREVRRLRVIND